MQKVMESGLDQQMMNTSRKDMREAMLPKVGEKMGSYSVVYVNSGKYRFTAEGSPLPIFGAMFESEGRIYEVERVDDSKRRFNAVFKGFKQNPIAEAPIEEDETLVKMI